MRGSSWVSWVVTARPLCRSLAAHLTWRRPEVWSNDGEGRDGTGGEFLSPSP